jgi:uncharacterized protein (TIGR00369 family)
MNEVTPAPVPRDILASTAGLDVFRRMIAGKLPVPPFSVTTEVFLIEAEDGRVVFEGTPTERFTNPLGGIHGGWIAALLDSAMGCAVHTKLAAGQAYTTVEFKVNLVRAVTPAMGKLICEGRVLHFGSRIATSEGFIRDGAGKLIAHGTETCLVMAAKS